MSQSNFIDLLSLPMARRSPSPSDQLIYEHSLALEASPTRVDDSSSSGIPHRGITVVNEIVAGKSIQELGVTLSGRTYITLSPMARHC